MHNETITRLGAGAFTIPTDAREGDGALAWEGTTFIVVTVWCNDVAGFGYSYTDASAARLINTVFAPLPISVTVSRSAHTWLPLQRGERFTSGSTTLTIPNPCRAAPTLQVS